MQIPSQNSNSKYPPVCGSGGATPLLPSDGGVEEHHGDPTAGPRPKVWNRSQKWKK